MTTPSRTPDWIFRLEAALVRLFYHRLALHPDVPMPRADRCLFIALERLEPDRMDELLELSMSDEIADFINENGQDNVADFIESALEFFDLNMEQVHA